MKLELEFLNKLDNKVKDELIFTFDLFSQYINQLENKFIIETNNLIKQDSYKDELIDKFKIKFIKSEEFIINKIYDLEFESNIWNNKLETSIEQTKFYLNEYYIDLMKQFKTYLLRENLLTFDEITFKEKSNNQKFEDFSINSFIRNNTDLDWAYKVLGLNTNSDIEQVKLSYKILVKKYHPDINKEKDAEDKFKLINEAYNLIKKG